MGDKDPETRFRTKCYDVLVNDIVLSVSAQSIGEAVRRASNLILDETDVVIIRLKR